MATTRAPAARVFSPALLLILEVDMGRLCDLSEMARTGYRAQPGAVCPHYDSSPNGMAWLFGAWLAKVSRPAPRSVHLSRGYSLRSDGTVYVMQRQGAHWEAK